MSGLTLNPKATRWQRLVCRVLMHRWGTVLIRITDDGEGFTPFWKCKCCGAWACHNCHDLVDRRKGTNDYDYDFMRLAHAEGVIRTIAALVKEGVL